MTPLRVAHEVTNKKVKRYPLDPLFTPVCATCGPISDSPIDAEDARIAGKRHVSMVLAGEVAG